MADENTAVQIIVTHYVNPHLFWFRTLEKKEDFTDCGKWINQVNLINSMSTTWSPLPNELVIIFYVEWAKFVKGKLLEGPVSCPSQYHRESLVIVWLVDYGFPIVTKLKYIHPVPDGVQHEFRKNSKSIFCAGLYNIVPKNFDGKTKPDQLKWDASSSSFLEDLLLHSPKIKFIIKEPNKRDMILGELQLTMDDGRQVLASTEMIEADVVKRIDNDGQFLDIFSKIGTINVPIFKSPDGMLRVRLNKLHPGLMKYLTDEDTDLMKLKRLGPYGYKSTLSKPTHREQMRDAKYEELIRKGLFEITSQTDLLSLNKTKLIENKFDSKNGKSPLSGTGTQEQSTPKISPLSKRLEDIKCQDPVDVVAGKREPLKEIKMQQEIKIRGFGTFNQNPQNCNSDRPIHDKISQLRDEIIEEKRNSSSMNFNQKGFGDTGAGEMPMGTKIQNYNDRHQNDFNFTSPTAAQSSPMGAKYDDNPMKSRDAIENLTKAISRLNIDRGNDDETQSIQQGLEAFVNYFTAVVKESKGTNNKNRYDDPQSFKVPQNNFNNYHHVDYVVGNAESDTENVPVRMGQTGSLLKLKAVLCHGIFPIMGVKNLKDADFNPDISTYMELHGMLHPLDIQSEAWDLLMDAKSAAIVAPPKSGKTWAFLPPICSLIKRQMLQSDGNVRMVLILTETADSAEAIGELCKKLTCNEPEIKVAIPFSRNAPSDMRPYIRNCQLLVCTPTNLLRLVPSIYEHNFLLKVQYLVVDNMDSIVSNKEDDLDKALMLVFRMCELKLQLVITSMLWTERLSSLVRKMPEPTIVIGDAFEAAMYGRVEFVVKLIEGGRKMSKDTTVIEFLRQHLSPTNRILIVCKDSDEADRLANSMDAVGIFLIKFYNYGNVHSANVESTIAGWKFDKYNNCQTVICTDDSFNKLDAYHVNILIHYSIPNNWRIFSERFTSMISKIPNILKVDRCEKKTFQNEKQPLISFVLIDDSAGDILQQLMNRLGAQNHNYINNIDPSVLQLSEKIARRKQTKKLAYQTMMCPAIIKNGECNDDECEYRHEFIIHSQWN